MSYNECLNGLDEVKRLLEELGKSREVGFAKIHDSLGKLSVSLERLEASVDKVDSKLDNLATDVDSLKEETGNKFNNPQTEGE